MKFNGDKCPNCGEEVEIEYGHVYAEEGQAWHEAKCLSCETTYTVVYRFECIEDIH